MGARSRRTGAVFEREVARLLTAASGVTWGRTTPGDTQEFGDVVPKGVVGPPWDRLFVECKAHATVNPGHLLKPCELLLGWWTRAVEEAEKVDRIPVLFVRFKGWGVAAMVRFSSRFPAKLPRQPWIVEHDDPYECFPWRAFDAEALVP